MDGTLGEDAENPDELTARVHAELIALRGQHGILTVQRFSKYEALRTVCGGGDLLDAFLMFEREMKRYISTAGRDEVAAAISIVAPEDNVIDRLEHAVGALPKGGKLRDQRTARRWSDAGLETMARDLVYMATVQGRLGQELLNIEISGDEDTGLHLIVDQMTTVGLPDRSPLIRIWHYQDDEPEEHALSVDLDTVRSAAAANGEYSMKRHNVAVDLPADHDTAKREGAILTISIEGRDAPMRTVGIHDRSSFPPGYDVSSMLYRTIVTITLAATDTHPNERA